MKRRDFVANSALAATGVTLAPAMSMAKGDYMPKMRDRIVGTYEEREITEPVWLCSDNGRLNPDAVGWSRTPMHRFNLEGSFTRKKRWHYWCVTTDDFLFSFTISDVDFAGVNFAYFLDYDKNELYEQLALTPFGRGIDIPDVVEGDAILKSKKMPMSIIHKPGRIDVRFSCPNLGGRKVDAELEIAKPEGHETLNVVIPWSSERFQFTSKQNTLPTQGVVTVDGKKFEFEPGKSWATMDFGRGIWPYRTAWNWGTFSGTQDGDTIGINLGGKWTDGTGMNENGICHNGRLYKISEDLLWEYDRSNWLAPWRIRTEYSDTLDLTMTPFYDKVQNMNVGVLKTAAHQCFGHYTGTIKVEGKHIEIKNLMGWAEEHVARW